MFRMQKKGRREGGRRGVGEGEKERKRKRERGGERDSEGKIDKQSSFRHKALWKR